MVTIKEPKNNSFTFFKLTGIWLLLCLLMCLAYSQISISLWLNGSHQFLLDVLFYAATFLGDGIFAVALGLIYLFFDKKFGLTLIITYAVSSGFAQLLKHTIFSGFNRPLSFITDQQIIHTVFNTEVHSYNSFPSGHTTTAFVLAGLFALHYGRVLLPFLLAVLVALSRIYLFQHFLRDTMAGCLLGSAFAWLGYYLLITKNHIQVILNLFQKK